MTITPNETICAISSPPGNGAIAIIRISGKDAITITWKIISPFKKVSENEIQTNTVYYAKIQDRDTEIDRVLVSVFLSPHTYTGEDTVEIYCHGSHFIQQRILGLLISHGARLATPGEFTQRAFLNSKMDLSQAEAVADLIAAETKASHDIAINQMRGGFSGKLKQLRSKLVDLTCLLELELDFGEEDVEFADRSQLQSLLEEIMTEVKRLMQSFELGNAIKNGVPTAIVGRPNTGKSTLLNLLLNEERAIVSDIAGTTRDSIEDTINIEGINFRFIDTAGLRESEDVIESLGIQRTREKITKAKIVILMVNATDCLSEISMHINDMVDMLDESQYLVVIANKIDQYSEEEIQAKFSEIRFPGLRDKDQFICMSAKKGTHLEKLNKILLDTCHYTPESLQGTIISNARHLEALEKASRALTRAREAIINGVSHDFISQDTREAIYYIGQITGEVSVNEVLGNIFERFCIGK